MRTFRPGLAVGLLLLSSTAARAGDLAYAQNFLTGSKQIVAFAVGIPGAMSIIGPQPSTLAGMDFDPSANVLWAIDFATQALGTIDRTTAAFVPVAAIQGGCCVNALSVDPVTGVLYVAKGDNAVYSLDPASGNTVQVGIAAPQGAAIVALAMDCSGRLVAATGASTDGNFYATDSFANPELVGFPGYSYATSIEFDNDDGALYAWFNASGTDFSAHARIDPATAAASQTSVVSGKYRMAIRNTCFRIFTDAFES